MSSPRPSPTPTSTVQDCWDCMLPGPPSRNNFGSADVSPSGLLAFPAGSSISVLDTRSMQLVVSLPMPPPTQSQSSSAASTATSSLSPFVTSVRWTPLPLGRDLLSTEPSSSHLLLAAGDRQGRIALLDLRLKSPVLWFDSDTNNNSRLAVQDLCWVQARPDSYLLAAISGFSSLSLYASSTGRCFWKYDAAPEVLSCIRRDPFDSRHFCVVGLKGFLLSVTVLGETEDEVVINELQIRTECSELLKLERDLAGGGGGGVAGSTSSSSASAAFPLYVARFAFSPQWRHIVFVTFPRELVVFDLQYETQLFSAALPRGCGKFLDVLPDPNNEFLYCGHVDGRLSTWRRKEGEQVHIMCSMEELLPSIGTSVPSPSVLALAISQSDSTLQNIGKIYSDQPDSPFSAVDFDNPFDFCDEPVVFSKTHLISISDDGKIWNWLLTAEGPEDNRKDDKNLDVVSNITEVLVSGTSKNTVVSSTGGVEMEASKQSEQSNGGRSRSSSSTISHTEISLKICLVGQLQLLSSAVTMLAVPSPSSTATLGRGGNYPVVAVPLVALGTQSGIIDIVDVSANAVAASFSVHNGTVRGLRWLGNSRLVSFSYTQVSEKTGGFINRLIVTCLRSGLNKPFRVLQKPERAPIRALRTSSSGRYLLILLRDAPVEVWAMTKTPIMLRSLALPFTVLEWTLPTVPRPPQNAPAKQSLPPTDQTSRASDGTSSPNASSDSKGSDGSQDDTSESFAFALSNGALGVFEVHGRRIRDFRPKWPSSSFVSSDGLITAMAYRLPHVVMGDRSGNIRWWDVTTGHSSSFNTHREGIRRIKFSPVVPGDRSRGRVAVLFYDNTFSVFDLDSPDPLANSLLQPQFPGTLVLELDWLPLRTDKNDPLLLCIAGADSSFRLVEINIIDKKLGFAHQPRSIKERFRPMPLCSPILLPTPHALALRMILQLGVKPSWFNTCSTTLEKRPHLIPGTPKSSEDLRSYMMDIQTVGDPVVPELLLKVLEPYRKEGCILDDERAKLYAKVVNKGCSVRFAFAAAIFGESSEALFWLQLPHALNYLMNKSINKSPQKATVSASVPELDDASMLSRITSKGKSVSGREKKDATSQGQLRLMAFEQEELWANASERIPWHEKLEGEEAIQNRVHELVSVGNLEAAVSLLLSTPPESKYFSANALRAVALSSAVSKSLLELAVKVVAANMVRTDRSLSGTHLLCAVGRYQEACSQLQDAGCWTDAATLAATHLKGSDYARVLLRWAAHVLHAEHNIWRALILYVAAGAMQGALAALREVQQPDTAAMFILACREIHATIISESGNSDDESKSAIKDKLPHLPGLGPENEDVIAVGEYFGQYQRKLVHLCMDSQPYAE
ncbi:putative transcription factor WD40-like family [Rosa chinensis]|uniref:Putative transcription factor WD40-like family n=1 Tax=Rosa chinensis TaxID=74649 RepID=A0A2P6RIT1_ROSCH|nr:WD repeat-containing protein 11 [Rosa chinensis]PRQ46333.1 putative transcription factor WD40-like family [Rosa chinensis]